MIFSTDNCPLCGDKLDLEIIEVAPGKVAFDYSCKKRELVRNDTDTATVAETHYKNACYKGGSLCSMIILPFKLFHSESNHMTSVYDARKYPRGSSKKLIFRTGLLDLDYARPQVVLNRLKVLVTFS
jgi:hypothetical protein